MRLRLSTLYGAPYSLVQKLGYSENADECRIEDEEQKVLHVVQTHTVGDPAAVVVHSDDAPAASAAMVGARRTVHYVASFALPRGRAALRTYSLLFDRAHGTRVGRVHYSRITLLEISPVYQTDGTKYQR